MITFYTYQLINTLVKNSEGDIKSIKRPMKINAKPINSEVPILVPALKEEQETIDHLSKKEI